MDKQLRAAVGLGCQTGPEALAFTGWRLVMWYSPAVWTYLLVRAVVGPGCQTGPEALAFTDWRLVMWVQPGGLDLLGASGRRSRGARRPRATRRPRPHRDAPI